MTRRPPAQPPRKPPIRGGLLSAGSWRGHYPGCITAGCEATRCVGGIVPLWARIAWLDETARLGAKP